MKGLSDINHYEKHTAPGNLTLGAFYSFSTHRTLFRLWSPAAHAVDVLVFETSAATEPVDRYELEYDVATGVWSYTCTSRDLNGLFYEYEVTTSKGKKRCLDPYAFSMAPTVNQETSGRAAVICFEDERAGSLTENRGFKAIKLPSFPAREQAVIYEISVRDATVSPEGTGGTYVAFGEKLQYLKNLGVTHIQLMPVLKFFTVNETDRSYDAEPRTKGSNYNWGYDPQNYFTPSGWFSEKPEDPYARIRELRSLVTAAHAEGIRVILDVVYNHMARTDFLDDIVPGYFFRTDEYGNFTSASGCGNDLATERKMVRRLILDSTLHFVRNYDIDGFRFDLMGLIDTETVLACWNACRSLKPDVLFIGEGWKMYNGSPGTVGMDQNFVSKTDAVSVFNDEFRDLCKAGGMNETGRGFLTGKSVSFEDLFANCLGSPCSNYIARTPGDSVLYLDCHDGLTLHDAIALNTPVDEKTETGKKEMLCRLKLANALLLTSQGVVFLHAGQESGRTKKAPFPNADECIWPFVRNSYNSSDTVNAISWPEEGTPYEELSEYTAGLISLRKAQPVFWIGDASYLKTHAHLLSGNQNTMLFGYSIEDREKKLWLFLFNGSEKERYFHLNDLSTDVYGHIDWYVDRTHSAAIPFKSSAFTPVLRISPLSALVLSCSS